MATTVSQQAAELRARAQKLLEAAKLLEEAEGESVPLSDSKIGRFSQEGMRRLKEWNAEKWQPCPKQPPCMTRDKKSGQMRIKKHRALGKNIHPHMKGAQVKEVRRSA